MTTIETMSQQDMSAVLQPKRILMAGYACQSCGVVQFPRRLPGTEEEMQACRDQAARCCAPRTCDKCGEPAAKSRTWCKPCMDKREMEKWLALPVAATGTDPCGYVVAFHDRYFADLEDYLETCFLDEVEPESGLPEWCSYQDLPMRAPDLDEYLFEDSGLEDHDTPEWVNEIQTALEKAIKENPYQIIAANGTRPEVPTIAEMRAEDSETDHKD